MVFSPLILTAKRYHVYIPYILKKKLKPKTVHGSSRIGGF